MTGLKRALLAAVFFAAAGPAWAQLNIGSILDAVKGVAKSQEVANMSEEEEIAVGRQIAANTLGVYPLVGDEKLQRYLNQVGLWIALQSERPHLPWRFAAVKSEQINAFAVPGGTVLVTQGMLNLLANEAELACVLGHEIGHINRKHHLTLLQKEMLIQTGAQVVSSNLGGGGIKGEAKRFLVGEGAEVFTRSLDRGSEREADEDGVLLAARAGYDPEACFIFMQRMAALKQEAGALESLYKTHPKASERVGDIERTFARLEGGAPGTGERPKLAYKKP